MASLDRYRSQWYVTGNVARDENHGLSGCVGWSGCRDCGGVCSTDDTYLAPYRPVNIPRDMPGYRWDVARACYIRELGR